MFEEMMNMDIENLREEVELLSTMFPSKEDVEAYLTLRSFARV